MSHLKVILFSFIFLGMFVLPGVAGYQKLLSVQIREAQLRSSPSFLGKITNRLAYGRIVEVLKDQGAWKRVAVPGSGIQGWVHVSTLTTKKIALQSGTADVKSSVTGAELALAGKGFNAAVEDEFKKKNSNLDFTWVDRMETLKFTTEEIQEFLRDGHVITPEGGV
ncbi:MAG: SH3 domain-containing protein [Syntrophales bacterium]